MIGSRKVIIEMKNMIAGWIRRWICDGSRKQTMIYSIVWISIIKTRNKKSVSSEV